MGTPTGRFLPLSREAHSRFLWDLPMVILFVPLLPFHGQEKSLSPFQKGDLGEQGERNGNGIPSNPSIPPKKDLTRNALSACPTSGGEIAQDSTAGLQISPLH